MKRNKEVGIMIESDEEVRSIKLKNSSVNLSSYNDDKESVKVNDLAKNETGITPKNRNRRPDQQLYVPKAKRLEERAKEKKQKSGELHSTFKTSTKQIGSGVALKNCNGQKTQPAQSSIYSLNTNSSDSAGTPMTVNAKLMSGAQNFEENVCRAVNNKSRERQENVTEISVLDDDANNEENHLIVMNSNNLTGTKLVEDIPLLQRTVRESMENVSNLLKSGDCENFVVSADGSHSDGATVNNSAPVDPDLTTSAETVESVSVYSANSGNIGKPSDGEEDSWDALYDDNGDCLDPSTISQIEKAVGKVSIDVPHIDYLSFKANDPQISDDEFGHVVEIYNFPTEFKTPDLIAALSQFKDRGFNIKWVDDTHALAVFSSIIAAEEALHLQHPFIKMRPLSQGIRESKMKAKRAAEFLRPYKARPETSAILAKRLVAGALGLHLNVSKQQREEERRKLQEAKERKKLIVKQREAAWEGIIDNE